MKINNTHAFSLIEVIVATGIITTTLFWVYKLIGENVKISEHYDKNIHSSVLMKNTKNCLANLGFNYFDIQSETTFQVSLWNNGELCNTTSLTPSIVNDISYNISINQSIKNTDSIIWDINISGDRIDLKNTFTQYKK